jgi:hypothetical protein
VVLLQVEAGLASTDGSEGIPETMQANCEL